ncbi:hypothetical protein [Halomonas sp. BC04]|uniref:hypothetical protein n=1 Tax=Halomonas sp. BC04 TaxID=1403540 RepID=UPI0003ED7576|nr:hypothetical protein [Halomonas sp. BC04]EWG99694.1 hypothetical protein Q427_23455 [Halomonas sp. BC04]
MARLADGALAATLQSPLGLEALDVSLSSPGAGQALGIRLAFTELQPHHNDVAFFSTLLATCHAGLARALQQPMPCPSRVTSDLDGWPRRLAQRLVTQATHPEATDTLPPAAPLLPG